MANFISNLLSGFFGKKSDRDIKEIMPLVNLIKAAYENIKDLSNDELREKSAKIKQTIANYIKVEDDRINELKKLSDENPDMDIDEKEKIYIEIDQLNKTIKTKIEAILLEMLPETFAIVKETAKRFTENENVVVLANQFDRDLAARKNNIVIQGDKALWSNTWTAGGNMIKWDMIHYDVQLFGGVVLHKGSIAEMGTGEGKTLVATLPVFLNALAGKGVHLVTVNDYLAKRDSEWMAPIFEFHGLRVDCIDKHEPNSEQRRNAYLADITYGTNNEFGFDYLRDNMTKNPEELVQRGHHFSIVDEVDSVLIDDARTPLIISGPVHKGDKQEFDELKPRIEKLVNAQKALINNILADAKKQFAEGKEKEAGFSLLKLYRGLPKHKAFIKFLSELGVKALLLKTENFYMQDQSKQMHLVDEDLYFVIDEKNNSIELTEKGVDLISTSSEDASFFILPDIGSDIAEIEKSNLSDSDKVIRKSELLNDFSIKSERVHTINQLLKAYTLFEIDVEYVVMDNKIKIVDEQTGRILDGRRYSDGLHQAIEAKENVKIEAATQTFATITLQNYFRMYHKLAGMTGTAETEAGELWDIYKLDVVVIPTNRPIARDDREDLVYKTTREKFNAVIDDIQNLVTNGRPVLVGTTSVETSELLSRMLKLRGIKHNVLNAKQHQKEADIVAEAGFAGTVTIATNMAGRGTDIKLGPGVKEAGGLAIIGTERHESRRVDRQLRGRAGRQGDPGSSQFYVALEDNLMRLFGSDRIAKFMDRLGLKEGEVIQHSMITKSIERAQKKVEENNFGIRKRLLEYDDVMNSQREVIYGRRKNALFGDKLSIDISNMIFDVCENITNENHSNNNFDNFQFELIKTFGIESPVDNNQFHKISSNELIDLLYDKVSDFYKNKNNLMSDRSFPVIKDVYENSSHIYENILVPVTDGKHGLQVLVNLKKAYETKGKELVLAFEKFVNLISIDEEWKEHLREMDELKQSVQNAAYEQKDPLLIYKFESFNLFKEMINKVNKEIVAFLFKGNLPKDESRVEQTSQTRLTSDLDKLKTGRSEVQDTRENQKAAPVVAEKRIGRNDQCPCGSGKKYKHCHGINEA
ncbi:MAG: preprotein translocase subunit SecA [Bacteroidota bacterium]